MIWLLFLLFPHKSLSQEYAGKDFWLAFIDIDECAPRAFPMPMPNPSLQLFYYDTTEIYMTSRYHAVVSVQVPRGNWGDNGPADNYSDTFHLLPGKTRQITMPIGLQVRQMYSDLVLTNGVHVQSDSDIYVQCANRFGDTTRPNRKGATAVLPVSSVPNTPEYIITTCENSSTNACNSATLSPTTYDASSEFVVVGIADESWIEVFPTSSSKSGMTKAYKPVMIRLFKGQVYFYSGVYEDGVSKDLTGTIVRSKTKKSKFVVFAGNRFTGSTLKNRNNLSCNGNYTDHVFEQILPTENWGKQYSALPFAKNKGGYFLRIVAMLDNTSVRVDNYPAMTLNAGQLYVFNVNSDTAVKVIGSKPISVAQFTKTPGCNEFYKKPDLGNVSMVYLVSDDELGKEAYVNPVDQKPIYSQNPKYKAERYVNVLCKTADTSYFRIGGKHLHDSFWKQSNALKGYSYAQIDIDSNTLLLQNPKGFLAYLYGFRYHESFAMTVAGHHTLKNYNFIFDQSCKRDTGLFQLVNADSLVNIKWRFGNDPTIYSGDSQKYVFPDTGYMRVTLYAYNQKTSKWDTLSKRIYITIADHTPVLINDTLICGAVGFTVTPKNITFFKEYNWNGGHPSASQYIKHAGLYWLKVTERNGCSFIDTLIVSSTPRPVADFKRSDSLICSNFNHPIRFVNLSTSYDSIVSNVWDFDDFNPVDTAADTVYHTFPKVGQYRFSLKVKTTKGCEDDTFGFVEILKGPDARFSALIKDSCVKTNQVTFTNLTVKDSLLHKRFKWYFSEGYVISNNNPPGPRSYSKDSQFFALLIYENQNGCIDTARKDIRIYKEPKADFKFAAAVTCFGDSTGLINTSTSKYNPFNSTWTLQSGQYMTPNLNYRFAKTGTYPVRLKVTSPQGCKDSISKNVRVVGGVHAAFDLSDSQMCFNGHQFILKDRSRSDSGAFSSKVWKFSDAVFISDKDSISKKFSAPGVFSVNLVVENDLNCKDSLMKFMQVYADPKPLMAVNDPAQCFNAQDFDFTLRNHDPASTYVWYYNSDSSRAYPFNNLRFAALGQYKVRVMQTDSHGCKGADTLSVVLNPVPQAAFVCSDTSMCLKFNSFVLNNQSKISSGNIRSYSWDFGDGTTAIGTNATVKYKDSGRYTIRLMAISDSMCADSATRIVEVFPGIKVRIPNIPAACLGDSSLIFSQMVSGNGASFSPLWDLGDGQTASGMQVKHRYKDAGRYTLKLYMNNSAGCSDTFYAGNQAVVYGRPTVSFDASFRDGMNGNTLASFKNTTPGPRALYWDFAQFGKASGQDTLLDLKDTVSFWVKLTVTDYNNCSDTLRRYFFVGLPYQFFLPNAFTPNGDGINEKFGPYGITYAYEYTFRIYNRWGEMVFESNDFNEFWDGRYRGELCANGVYVYRLVFRDYFGRYKDANGTFLLMGP